VGKRVTKVLITGATGWHRYVAPAGINDPPLGFDDAVREALAEDPG